MAWYLYIVRTPTIAKNRHLNIVLRVELHVRTGTYDRPNLAKALAIDAYPRIALLFRLQMTANMVDDKEGLKVRDS